MIDIKKIYDLIFEHYYPLITGTKKPNVQSVSEENSIPYEEIIKHNDYGATLKPGTIMVDIDDMDKAKKVKTIIETLKTNCIIIQTTSGMHFHFINTNIKSNKQHYFTPLGIKTETKYPHQNVVTPIKLNNKIRKIIYSTDTLDKLPVWLIPLSKKFNTDFSKLEEGDGRNDTLFSYILTLQQQAMTKDEIRSVIKVINQFILKDPVSDKELEVILRDKAFLKESFYIKGKLQYEKLANYLIREHNVIKINDNLHIYKNGYYTSNKNFIEEIMFEYIVNSTRAPRSEVTRYLEIKAKEVKPSNEKFILVKNGIINLETKELLEFTPNIVIQNKISVNYNPGAYSEVMDKTLNKICCNDKQLRLLIEEMIGYCLFRRNELGKCFILTGDGSNGKSTLLDIMNEFLGEENIASVDLKELKDRFKTFQLEGKLANIGDDISNQRITDDSVFKKLVTGQKVNVERKGKDPFDFNNYSKLIFSANDVPEIDDTSGGLKRRIEIIPFNAKFTKKDPDYDPFIIDKLLSEQSLEYLLKIALQGLDRVLFNRSFTVVESVEKAKKEFEINNNPVLAFLNDEDNKIENESYGDVHLAYQVFIKEKYGVGFKNILDKDKLAKEILRTGSYTSKTAPKIIDYNDKGKIKRGRPKIFIKV